MAPTGRVIVGGSTVLVPASLARIRDVAPSTNDDVNVRIRDSITNSLRSRELAGDVRAGSWVRQQVWRTQLEFIRRSKWRLAAGWLLLASPALLASWFVPVFLQGLVLGAALTGATAMVWSLVVQATGTGPRMMGDDAEQWTAQELRKLRRSGWRLFNHVALAADSDIDHVLIGPRGVVVVETKWSATSWAHASMAARVDAACAQVARNGQRVRNWAPVRRSGLPVRSVVALWGGGGGRDAPAQPSSGDGQVTVMRGAVLREWVLSQEWPLSAEPAALDALLADVDRQIRGRDAADLEKFGHLPTPAEWAVRAGLFVSSATAALLVTSLAVTTWGIVPGIAAGVGVAAVGLAAWCSESARKLRALALGIGLGAGLLVVAVLVALAVLTVV